MPFGLFSNARRESQQRVNSARRDLDVSRGGFMDSMGDLQDRSSDADQRAELGADDLFANAIQRLTDSTHQAGAGTREALSRIGMAGGGDVSGGAGVAITRTGQDTNRAIGEGRGRFENMATQMSMRERDRADRMTAQRSSAMGSLFSQDRQGLSQAEMLEMQRRQANRQLLSDMFGTAASVFG